MKRRALFLDGQLLRGASSRVRHYPSPIEQDDTALREQLRLEQQDESPHESREDREADYFGISRYGEL